VEQVDARLALRIPELVAGERRRLARTLVGDADAARIDPLLVLALIEIESAFDPAAISHRGARGLMQLRGPTLRREAERSGLDWRDPHDPIVNVQAGIRYLRRLLDAFGREELALMAYNAGPNRILGYLRAGEIPERFHAYPRKVMAEASRLRRAFGPLGAAIALAPARPRALPE
jgi:soluble lytic murein transglycosylase-like protein